MTDLVLTFEVFQGDALLHREEFKAESVTIGKGPAAMLRVESESVADLHVVINVNDDGSVQLLDLGSANGTRVNGEQVSNVTLANGDAIEIGELCVRIAMSQALAQKAADGPVDDEVTAGGGVPVAGEVALAQKAQAPVGSSEVYEDVMAFIMRSGTISSEGGDRGRPKVLEVAEIWGDIVMDVKHFPMGQRAVTLGANKANDFYCPVDALPQANFRMFEWDGAQFSCMISDKWAGFVDIGDVRRTFQDLIESGKAQQAGGGFFRLAIDDDTRIIADIGHFIFFAQMAHQGRKAVSKLSESLDYPFLMIGSFMGFLGLLFGIILATMPPPPENELLEIPDRFVELILENPDLEKPEPDKNPDAGEGAKAKKEEGKVGKKDAKMEKAKGDKVEMDKRQVDKEIAENAGVLGALREGSELDDVFGNSNLSSDLLGGVGGLIGAKGVQFGSGGLGARGSGLGGGGTAGGLGGLGTKGRGSGASGYGTGGGHFGAKGEGKIGTIGGEAIILGALDKSLVDAVVRRNLNQIRYCYQRELTKNPDLSGKVVVKFVIAKDGTVSSATTKSTTLNNAAVEQCINGRFMRFQFPEPKGGGIVIVSYPFMFSPG